jgi:aromatic ring-opening dioxygenase LigB subunit
LTLVYACIVPHGSEIIDEITPRVTRSRFRETRLGTKKLAKQMIHYHPDTVVIATPHNLRLWKHICVVTSENSSGKLNGQNHKYISLRVHCDVDFSRQLLAVALRRGLPVIGANYGSAEGEASDMPMDWGTFIPLWFLRHNRSLKVTIITPSREIPLTQNFLFGRLIADLMERDRLKRYVFIASADQAHAHKKSGPYGFNRAAALYDEAVLNAIRMNNLSPLLRLRQKFVENAKPDSLWQIAILAGILDKVKMQGQLLSYQVPTYYGMICAGFERQ